MKVSPIMLLKIHVEKMSGQGEASMSMKTGHIDNYLHYSYEKTGC